MPRITLKETITKEIEIPMDKLCDLIDHLSEEEKITLLKRVQKGPVKLTPFKKDKIDSIIADAIKSIECYAMVSQKAWSV
jgi:hypothetical protein